ncbi:serine protease inhibitor dipetalogastin-like [Ruditapes philippinarum]|uniref:serine protease inhibitor dipetalogastin-like n=1 Tax=Ruditapes philippinarum TaxID=129788 RepID=UPI00295A85F1|nr:serine protease inhibitor dipetalogastin-like [Ruditapes philippinarum]
MKLVFTLAFLVSAAFCQDAQWYCGILGNEDCMQHNVEERCGTNGVTYRNMCTLGKAHCADTSINQAGMGACNATATKSPAEVLHGSQVILDFECVMLSHKYCVPSATEKVCGTDARTYANFCEYEKAKCTHRDLHVAKLGDCNA